MNEQEIWKPIKNYEGIYEISNLGNVKSLNYNRTKKEKILKPRKDKKGYLYVMLYKNKYGKNFSIHRLVAQAFIPNPENKPEVDHINTIKDDNRIDNLKWATHIENNNNKLTIQRLRQNHADFSGSNHPASKKVYCIELDKSWDCINDCARDLKLHHQSISKVCKGKRKTCGGYHFEYLKK